MAALHNASQERKSNISKKVIPRRHSSYYGDVHLPTGITRAVRGCQTPPPVSPKPKGGKALKELQTPPPVPPKRRGGDLVTHGVAITRTPSLPFASPTSIAAKPPSAGPMDAVVTPPKTSALSKEISLKELASGHSKSFPLRIRTLEGFRGQTSQLSISIAEEYSIHFVKHQKVVTIKDSSRQLYNIPLSSAIRFGLIYNPGKQPAVSSEPFIFESVSDIIMSKSLPKVVCAMEAYAGDTDRASLSANEVLCITRVHKPKFHGRKSLEVFSLVTNTKKLLTLDCCVHFSTDPSLVQVHLPSILGHIPNLFPGQAVLFADEDFTKSVPYSSSALLSSPVTLINSQTKTSLVASPVINMEVPFEEGDCLIDIPLDEPLADVKIEIVQPDDANEVRRLQSKTHTLYETLDLSKVQTYQDAASENVYATQSLLNFSLERGHERVGIEIDAPSTIFGRGPPQVESMVSEEDPIPSDEDELYETVSLPKGRLALPAYEDVQAANMQEKPYGAIHSDDSSDYEVFEKSEYSVLAEKIEKLQRQVRNLESSFSSQEEGHAKSMKSLEEKVEQLTVQFKSLETQITQMSMNSVVRGSGSQMPMRHHGDGGGSSEDRNRSALQRLSIAQMQQLLDAMQLPQYKEAFLKEQVGGDVLIELDDQTLQSDLQINSKLHRVRLMKLISGSYSPENILASKEK